MATTNIYLPAMTANIYRTLTICQAALSSLHVSTNLILTQIYEGWPRPAGKQRSHTQHVDMLRQRPAPLPQAQVRSAEGLTGGVLYEAEGAAEPKETNL